MDKLVYLAYPAVLILLLAGARLYGPGQWNEESMSLRQCKLWQGFFAVCIMLHHAGQKTCAPWLNRRYIIPGLEFFVPIGYYFVAFFLVCSGYGLYKSVHAKPDYLKGFFRRRVLPVLAAFYAVEWIYIAVRLAMGEAMSAQQILLYLLGVPQANPNSWYVIATPVLYLAFYVCYRFIRRDGAALAGVFALTLLWVLAGCATDHNDVFMTGEWWYNSVLFFPLGMLLAKHGHALRAAAKRAWLPLLLLCAAAGYGLYRASELAQNVYGYYCEWSPSLADRVLRRLICVLSQTGAAGAFVCFVLLLGMKLRIGNPALSFMGGMTLEFYLIHAIFVELFGFDFLEIRPSLWYIKNAALYLAVIAACSVPAAMLLRAVLHPGKYLMPAAKE